jgi:hypothetical protein
MTTPTSNFRRQHDELMGLAAELSAVIERPRADDSVAKTQSILNRLAGKLAIHKVMEEDALYADLLCHERQDIRGVAEDFQRRFGAVYGEFSSFRELWDAPRVQQDYEGFVRAVQDLIPVLGERIEHENAELYDLVDELYAAR